VPNIPRALTSKVRKAMEALKYEILMEKRLRVHAKRGDDHFWLISIIDYSGSAEELLDLWKELERMKHAEGNVANWTRYKLLRSSFYEVKASSCHPGYLSCTCAEGITDKVCKHALLMMEKEKMIDPLPQPLEGRQKAGRKKKIGPALSMV
jgi:hypothetical protein